MRIKCSYVDGLIALLARVFIYLFFYYYYYFFFFRDFIFKKTECLLLSVKCLLLSMFMLQPSNSSVSSPHARTMPSFFSLFLPTFFPVVFFFLSINTSVGNLGELC